MGFWKSFWLPENITWADLELQSNPNMNFPDYRRLLISIYLALFIFVFRIFFEMKALAPIGIYFGIKNKEKNITGSNMLLEVAFQKKCKLQPKVIQGLAKQCDLTEEQVIIWFRQRLSQNKPPELVKFSEIVFHFLYTTSITIFGYIILKDRAWFDDTYQAFTNYPFQNLDKSIEWYYLISLAFYVSLVIKQFYDVKRKDFCERFIHHIATIILITFSFICNYVRLGSLILLTHNICDSFADLPKLLKILNNHKLADVTFIIFIFVWFATKLYVYPKLVYHFFFYVYESKAFHLAPLFLCFMALALQIISVIWTYFILILFFKIIKKQWEDTTDSPSNSEDLDEFNYA